MARLPEEKRVQRHLPRPFRPHCPTPTAGGYSQHTVVAGRLPEEHRAGRLPYGEPLETPAYTLTLHPAGHCLGSAQALVQSKATGERLLYTGDLRARPSPTNEPLQPAECDVLVIESTYGRSDYVFPPEEQVLATAVRTLRSWLSRGERPVVSRLAVGESPGDTAPPVGRRLLRRRRRERLPRR